MLLSCKAYDLESSIEAIAPAMEAGAFLLPILNGLRHYPTLDERFGKSNVLGGLCFISALKGDKGEVRHLGKPASVTFGEREGDPDSARCVALAQVFSRAHVEHTLSKTILEALWIKFTFLTTLAGATCLMRASVGAIVAAQGGEAFMQAMYAECTAVAAAAGSPIPAQAQQDAIALLTQSGSGVTASMLRDLESGQRVEGAHIVGDMLHRAREAGQDAPLLSLAWLHLQAYAERRDG